jgi:hypothetical protein
MSATVTWDVFVSYARDDEAPVRLLANALQDRGLRVFWDDHDIPPFHAISDTIGRALGSSRVLLAFYSTRYPTRTACLYELTAAFLAGQAEGDPTRRILVINPEPGVDHIHPMRLRDARHARVPRSTAKLEELATQIAAHVRTINGPIAGVDQLSPPLWLPAPVRPRHFGFEGRVADLWRVHSALHPYSTDLTSSHALSIAVVFGAPGSGKTALATEYAHRFGAAFPGGIFWLDARHSAPETVLPDQLVPVAEALTGEKTTHSAAMNAIAAWLHDRGERTLWIVDDLPATIDIASISRYLGPHPLSSSIITTCAPDLARLGTVIDLDASRPDEIDHAANQPASADERVLAWKLQLEIAHRVPSLSTDYLRRAMTSLYDLVQVIRTALRQTNPPPRARLPLIDTVYLFLQTELRPLLTDWHPALRDYEATRTDGDPLHHERRWVRHDELRAALQTLQQRMLTFLGDLTVITGSPYGQPGS